jgi:multiple sugar transport system ATP-binding protein
MRSEIKQKHQKLKTTTIYVTDDQVEAMTMADKIVVMNDGSVEPIGTPLDRFEFPTNLFVAGFIGSPPMNFLDGTIQQGCFIAKYGTRVPLPDAHLQTSGESVRLGIRPEHLELDQAGFPAKILTVKPTGSETQVLMQLAGQNVIGIFRERIANRPRYIRGLSYQPDRIHQFETKSGQRLTMSADN